ncbi:hypothetical protein [Vibrio profundum]
MINRFLVRATVGGLAILSIKISALYFFLMALLIFTHRKDITG